MNIKWAYALFGLVVITFTTLMLTLYASHYFFVFDDTALLVVARDSPSSQLLLQQTLGFWRPAGMFTHRINLHIFGWQGDSFFALLSVFVHAGGALLLLTLAKRLQFGNFAAVVASLLFLASPWATEAFMWVSAQFDLFAVFFMLIALNFVVTFVRAPSRSKRLFAMVVLLSSYTISVLYKENVVVAFIFVILVAWRINQVDNRRPQWKSLLVTGGATLAVSAVYLLIRNQIMNGLNGPYGSLASLWQGRDVRANGFSYLESLSSLFFRLPLDIRPLAFVFLLFVLLSIVASLTRPAVAAMLVGSLVIALLPTLWSGVPSETTVASRFAYMPGVVWSLLIGFGAGQAWEWASRPSNRKLRNGLRVLWLGLTTMALMLALMATTHQSQWWRFAVSSGRLVVDHVAGPELAAAPCVHVTNLPSATFEGPHVLKSYNLSHHFAARGLPVPKFRSDHVVISRFDGLVSIPQPEGFSESCEGETELTVTLPLDHLRP